MPVLIATIERVVDGDTVIVAVAGKEETVRLLGIDTPEKPGGPRPAECFGSQASDYASELLPVGTLVELTRDNETRDQYGRLLAYVHRSSDGVFINREMVASGHATPLFFAPNTAARDDFTTAANHARRSWIGFWDTCGGADIVLQSD